MSTNPQTLSTGLSTAMTQLQIAYGQLLLPDWQEHSAAIATATDALTQLYLHVDASTGAHHQAAIYLDTSRVVLGLIPRAVEPLLVLLERQTALLDMALEHGWPMPPAEAPAWAHWHERLARYRASLDRALASPTTPSEALWDEVTAPLLQGIYPADFAALGITNPKVPSKPDVTTVPTTAFMVALQAQELSGVQTWLLSWREGLSSWRAEMEQALTQLLSKLERVAQRTTRGLRVLGVGVALGAVGLGIWALSRD